MKESIFSVEAVRRQAEQEDLQKKAGLKEHNAFSRA